MNNPVLLLLLLCLLLPATWLDLRTRIIPNGLCLAGCVAGLTLALFQGWTAFGGSVLGMVLAFGLAFPFWLCRWFGAGDVKLLAAVGALAGIALLPRILVFTAMSGFVLALASILLVGPVRRARARFRPRPAGAADLPAEPEERFRLPYAVAIAMGSLLAVLLPMASRMPA